LRGRKEKKRGLWIQDESFPWLQWQAHHNNITLNPKTTTNGIKKSKNKTFSWAPMDALWEKQKWNPRKEEEMFTIPWLTQTTWKGDKNGLLWSPTPNLKLLIFRSLLEKKMKREKCLLQMQIWIVRVRKVYDSYNFPFHTRFSSSTPTPYHTSRFICFSSYLLKLTKYTR